MLRPIRSTREASASRAIGKPVPPSWRAQLGDRGRRRVDRPVPLGRVGHVGGHDLGRPAPLHREGPEAVERPDVETALPAQRGRQADLVRHVPEVEPARRDHARRELERVVPVARGDPIGQCLAHRGARAQMSPAPSGRVTRRAARRW